MCERGNSGLVGMDTVAAREPYILYICSMIASKSKGLRRAGQVCSRKDTSDTLEVAKRGPGVGVTVAHLSSTYASSSPLVSNLVSIQPVAHVPADRNVSSSAHNVHCITQPDQPSYPPPRHSHLPRQSPLPPQTSSRPFPSHKLCSAQHLRSTDTHFGYLGPQPPDSSDGERADAMGR